MSTGIVLYPVVVPIVFPAAAVPGATAAAAAAGGFSVGAAGASGASAGASAIGSSAAGAGGLGLLAPVGIGVAVLVAPVLVGALLDSLASTLSMSDCTKGRKEDVGLKKCSRSLEKELEKAVSLIHRNFQNAVLNKEGMEELLKEEAEIKKEAARIVELVGTGAFSPVDARHFRSLLERFSENLSRREQEAREQTRLAAYLLERVRKSLDRASESYPDRKDEVGEYRAKSRKFRDLPPDKLVEHLGALADLCEKVTLSFMEEKAVTDRDLLKPLQEIEFYLERLRTEFPRSTLGELETSVREARDSVFPEKILAIRDEIQLKLQKAREEKFLGQFFHDNLQASLVLFEDGHPVRVAIARELREPQISRESFRALSMQIEKALQAKVDLERKKVLQEKVREGLSRLDYVVGKSSLAEKAGEKLERGEILLLETRYPDYKVLIKLGEDESLVIRLIRVVETARERDDVSEFQRRKDSEMVKEWCGSVDILLEDLRKNGIGVNEHLRVEEKVDYMTIEQLELSGIHLGKSKKKAPGAPAASGRKKA